MTVKLAEHGSIELRNKIQSYNNNNNNKISQNMLDSWLQIGHRLLTIDNEDTFCDSSVLRDIVNSKTIFNQIDLDELRRARARCNPFDAVRRSIFLNV